MLLQKNGIYRFGQYTLHIEKALLKREEDVVLLPPKIFDLLVLLVKSGEGVASKEELLRSLWPDINVEETNLSQSVFILRRKLGKTPAGEEYVQSVPRKGYRLTVPVEEITSVPSQAGVDAPSLVTEQSPFITERPGGLRKSDLFSLACVLIFPLTLAGIYLQERPAHLSTLSYTQITRDCMDKRGSAHGRGGPVATLVTDGTRIYFTQGAAGETKIGEVSASGGDTATIPVAFAMTQVLDFSPARSELLIGGYTAPASSHRLWAMAVPGGAPHPIGEIEASDAAWSPDGSEIAFTKDHALYRALSDGSGVTRIANLPGVGWRPRWSPNADRIRLTIVDDRSKDQSLWEVRIDGSGLHPLLSDWNPPSTECCGDWSKDGKTFVFQATRDGKSEIWSMPETTRLRDVLRLDSPQKLTSAPGDLLTPKLAADGSTLYVLGQQLRGELVRYVPQEHQFLPYLGGRSFDFIEFSRDGKWIAYVAYPEGTLWRSRPDGREKLQLTFSPMKVLLPHWSPDGREIVFHGRHVGLPDRDYTVPASGGVPTPVLDDSVMTLDWLPDGRSFLYSDFPFFGKKPEDTGIHIVEPMTRHASTIPQSKGMVNPVGSPDGRYIAASTAAGSKETMLFDTRTRAWSKLVESRGIPRWSHDSQWLFYFRVGDEPAIMKIRISDRQIEHVADLGSIRLAGALAGVQFALSPDDMPILLRDTGTQEIYAVSLSAK